MNENENNDPSIFIRMIKDDGVQRAAAGIVVAVVIAGAKELIFGGKK